ncbi:MAG: protein translocase subunit SecF [Candidatus Margulisbacteria bacterium]|nr:protein translocase subunit SecF [Candidatus Margulisiibacteriota bacterium]
MKKEFFIKNRIIWYTFSSTLIIVGIISMFLNFSKTGSAFNLGIDFTGGTSMLLQVQSVEKSINSKGELPAEIRNKTQDSIRRTLHNAGVTNVQLTTLDKKYFSIRTEPMSKEKMDSIINELKTSLGSVNVLESDFIGPTIGHELQKQALTIIFVAIFLLLIYITFRFEFWAAVAAIIALVHDSLITLGLTSILKIQVDAAYVAAILTILGYSINDTIVIFDRVRENTKILKEDFAKIAETSIWQTLTRSINTVTTVLIVLAAIHFFGGVSLKDFSLVLLIGIFFGCYSSIFIASPLLVMFKKWSE